MKTANRHTETHRTGRTGWLRAAVLGANDGLISTASLIIGVASAHGSGAAVLTAGVAGLAAGAMSMAAGEYVSVSSQADTEKADLERERAELEEDREYETGELAGIYVERGLEPGLARTVAEQLMAKDALAAHSRDELGITEELSARPVQAALASAGAFSAGALLPILVTVAASGYALIPLVALTTLVSLGVLGAAAARLGGAGVFKPAVRVMFWGALAMVLTAAVGALFGASG